MVKVLERISNAVWGLPLITAILSVGIYYSFATGFIQLRGIKCMFSSLARSFKGTRSAYEAFATSLGATVGTGSVVGVAVALRLGGAGSVFWMWICGIFGMAVSFAEGVLSVKYRERTKDGYRGGMMYVISLALGSKPLGWMYALFATLACLGMGIMTQTGSVSQSLESLGVSSYISGAAVTLLLLYCLLSSSDRIVRLCSLFVPLLSAGYILLTLAVIGTNINKLPEIFGQIFSNAFGVGSAVGGISGYTVKTAISQGIRRGVFSNEAGLGTTASIHSAAVGVTPRAQGHINMLEVAIDTLVICTLTAFSMLCSQSEDIFGIFYPVLGGSSQGVVALFIIGFALATAVGWTLVGKSSFMYLTKGRLLWVYILLCSASSFLGSITDLKEIITLSDIFNGLMAIPCLVALWLLRKDVLREAKASL